MNPMSNRRIFTPGPVQMSPDILAMGAQQVPYFRNAEFSAVIKECESRLLDLTGAPQGSRVIFLAGSGSLAMESVVVNLLSPQKLCAVVNGGSFGKRFVDICRVHGVPAQEIVVDRDPLSDWGVLATKGDIHALLITGHETSVGHLYDLESTGRYCRQKRCLHIVDAISLFVTDALDMQKQGIDVLLLSSHKGLALPPGLAMVVLSPEALNQVAKQPNSFYQDYNRYLEDGLRGQTPFTPTVSIVLQLRARLEQLQRDGMASAIAQARDLAMHFREGIQPLPLKPYSLHMPNAMTALQVISGVAAHQVVDALERRHGCVVAPNGGALRDLVFRVGHMGNLVQADIDRLLLGLQDVLQ
jgi:aspartate aminotransferase-like enzyme